MIRALKRSAQVPTLTMPRAHLNPPLTKAPRAAPASGGRARGVAAATNAGTQLAFWARAGRLIAGDKERPTSWRERGPRLWDLSPEHALSNVRNHHSRRPRGSRVSIFGDPGVGRRKTRRRQRGVRASWPGIEVAARELVTARRQAPPGSRVREGLVVVRGRRRR